MARESVDPTILLVVFLMGVVLSAQIGVGVSSFAHKAANTHRALNVATSAER
jgi:hypothetical protein